MFLNLAHAANTDWVFIILAIDCLVFLLGILVKISDYRRERRLKAGLRPPIEGKTNNPAGGGDVIL